MITWMQKHKNYLVVTIWISVIAFVGAGFVGWGAYSFSNKGSIIAEVGDKEIKVTDLQEEYSRIYSFYANMFENNFNKEMAQQLQLENMAVKNLIDTTLFLNLADEFGFSILDSEISQKIISIESFQKDGIFDKNIYLSALKRAKLKPKDFEASIKKELLIDKVRDVFDINSSDLEIDSINSAFYMQDRVYIEKIDKSSVKVNITEEGIKDFWEKSKSNYMTKTIYEINAINLSINEVDLSKNEIEEYYNHNKIEFKDNNGKVLSFEDAKSEVQKELQFKEAKKMALKKYLKLKKDKIKVDTLRISEDDSNFNQIVLSKLKSIKVGKTIKPIKVENGFLVVKLINKTSPEIMPYEQAKVLVEVDFKNLQEVKALETEAKTRLANFEGEDLGFISRDDVSKFGLSEEESLKVSERIFGSKENKSYIVLNDKAVLFKISSQRLPKEGDMKNLDFINQNLLNIKDNLVNSKILDILKSRYKVKLYYKNSKGN